MKQKLTHWNWTKTHRIQSEKRPREGTRIRDPVILTLRSPIKAVSWKLAYVCVCVCVCVYTHIHTHTHIHTYMHTCIHTYICAKNLVQTWVGREYASNTCFFFYYYSSCMTWNEGLWYRPQSFYLSGLFWLSWFPGVSIWLLRFLNMLLVSMLWMSLSYCLLNDLTLS